MPTDLKQALLERGARARIEELQKEITMVREYLRRTTKRQAKKRSYKQSPAYRKAQSKKLRAYWRKRKAAARAKKV